MAATAGAAAACAICLSAVKVTPGQRLDNADQAVLAAVSGDGSTWTILDRIKGAGPVDEAQLAIDVAPNSVAVGASPVLLLRDGLGQRWTSLGTFDPEHADWLRKLAATPITAAGSDAEVALPLWRARLDLIAPMLATDDPAIEAMAHGELTLAPYAAVRDLGATWAGGDILALMRPEEGPDHIAAFILMLGASGDRTASSWIEAQLKSSDFEQSAVLAALIAADLEMRGPSRLGLIEQHFLLNRDQDLAAIEAAVLALQVHGDLDGAVPRAQIVEAYERLIQQRPALAGLVVMDLARWEEWGATKDFVTLLNTGAITDPAGEFAARNYVHLSADTDARAALEPYDD